jgi:hypothetical protein
MGQAMNPPQLFLIDLIAAQRLRISGRIGDADPSNVSRRVRGDVMRIVDLC